MHGRVSEVVEVVDHGHVDMCWAQESRWEDCSARLISAKSFEYKFILSGGNLGFGGYGV